MDLDAIRRSPIGELVAIRGSDARTGDYDYFAFVPDPLPEAPPLSTHTWTAVAESAAALGRLQQSCTQLPNPRLLIAPALAREAVSTSALEGTFGELPDVLEARVAQMPPKSPEVVEIRAYEHMAEQAFVWVRDRPITNGMLADLQGILARESRNPPRDPGRVRRHQVFIGPRGCTIYDARFVPPPPDDRLHAGMEEWQRWIQAQHDLPAPLVAAMAHYQFEALHPFADGNGRVGRLLIVLQLLKAGAIPEPALTLSPWLLRRREQYQDQLLRLSQTGDWNPWVSFFCEAIVDQCAAHVEITGRLMDWLADVRDKLHASRWGGVIHRIVEGLIEWPVITHAFAAEKYGVSVPAAKSAIDRLVRIGVLQELTGRSYRRVFGAVDVINAVESL